METEEQIQVALSLAGSDMEFDFGIIKGIIGEEIFNAQSYDSIYDVEVQEISFRCAASDIEKNEVAKEQTFLYIIGTIQYTFEILYAVPDYMGWYFLKVKTIGREDV